MSSSPALSIPSISIPSQTPTSTTATSADQTSSATPLPSSSSDTALPSSSSDPASQSASSQSQSASSALPSSTSDLPSSTSSAPASSSTSSFSSSSFSSQPASSTTLYQTTQPDGEVVTVTTVVSQSPTATESSAAANSTSSKGFFGNKGAVAGVFTIVGLVAVVIAIALITNAIRRRKAKKFDRDVAEAAAEAASAAHNVGPDFDDDEYGYANRSVYTDHTHGTYNQTPMKHQESYNMSELPTFDPYNTGATAAAGNAGVGAAGLNRSRSTTAPYNAFAGPQGVQPPMPAPPDPYFDSAPAMPMHGAYPGAYHDPQASLLDAAGFGAPAAAGVAVAATGAALSHSSTLSRNKSSGTRTLGGLSGSDHQDPYADDPYNAPYPQPSQQYPYPPQTQPQRGYSPPQPTQYSPPQQAQYLPPQQAQSAYSHSNSHSQEANRLSVISANDPYAGYASPSPAQTQFPNPHSPGAPLERRDSDDDDDESSPPPGYAHEAGAAQEAHYDEYDRGALDSRASLRDEEDYGYGGSRRVLKVANE